jgi:hypothetical protein
VPDHISELVKWRPELGSEVAAESRTSPLFMKLNGAMRASHFARSFGAKGESSNGMNRAMIASRSVQEKKA